MIAVMDESTRVSETWREHVLHGVTRRRGLPPGVPPPISSPRLINGTFPVDDPSLNDSRGRAVVEGIPMFYERRIRLIEGVADL